MKHHYLNLIFFDGECGVCNATVNIILKIDKKKQFLFTSLQGMTAKKYLTNSEISNLSTIIVFANGNYYKKSKAVLYILSRLGRPWNLFLIFKIIPINVLDLIYDSFAKVRYFIFGKTSCRIPTKEEKLRFLE